MIASWSKLGRWSLGACAWLALGCEPEAPKGNGGEFKPPVEPAKQGGGEFVPGKDSAGVPDAGGAAASAKFEGAGVHLPRPGELGLTLVQGPDYYTKDNLFEIIDGGSEGYIAYGVKQMAKASYKANEAQFKDELNVEIYDFGPQWGAFGKFGRERSSCGKVEGLGDQWCVRKSDLIFWKGAVMVKVQTFDDSPAAEATILKVGKEVEKKLAGDATPPPALAKFPADHKEPGSGGWSPQALFGFEGLQDVYLHGYRPAGDAYQAPDAVVTLFMVDKGSAEEAGKLFEAIKAKAGEQEKVKASGGIKALEGVGDQAFWYEDGLGKHTVVRKGQVLGGGRDFKDPETAKDLTGKLAGSM